MYDQTRVDIGEGCLLSDGIEVFTSDHHSIIDLDTNNQINFPANVTIGERVWVGKSATIMKGSTIGNASIIGAKSLVNGEVPSCQLWGGSPARMLKENVSWVGSHPANRYDIDIMMRSIGRL